MFRGEYGRLVAESHPKGIRQTGPEIRPADAHTVVHGEVD